MRKLILIFLMGLLTSCGINKHSKGNNDQTIEEFIQGKWDVYQEVQLTDTTISNNSKSFEFSKESRITITKEDKGTTKIYQAKYIVNGINIEIYTPNGDNYYKSDECKITHLDDNNMVLETIFTKYKKVIFLKR